VFGYIDIESAKQVCLSITVYLSMSAAIPFYRKIQWTWCW